jgi:DNA modification methylase
MGDNARCFGQDLMRGEHTVGGGVDNDKTLSGTSVFDPVLCELVYRWYSPKGGIVVDPFAGGSVRGIVASKLGRQYVGVELRNEQIEANELQREICGDPQPVWKQGDSARLGEIVGSDTSADLIFSCPPYGDLEVYSDDPADLSNMAWGDFCASYRGIISQCAAILKEDSFACFVVSDIRDEEGFYRDLPGATISAFQDAGLKLYNRAILVTAIGSLPIRVGKQFKASRKLGATHQYVLIFAKGDPKKATNACGHVEVDDSIFETQDT